MSGAKGAVLEMETGHLLRLTTPHACRREELRRNLDHLGPDRFLMSLPELETTLLEGDQDYDIKQIAA